MHRRLFPSDCDAFGEILSDLLDVGATSCPLDASTFGVSGGTDVEVVRLAVFVNQGLLSPMAERRTEPGGGRPEVRDGAVHKVQLPTRVAPPVPRPFVNRTRPKSAMACSPPITIAESMPFFGRVGVCDRQ